MSIQTELHTPLDIAFFLTNLNKEGRLFDFEADIEELGIFEEYEIPYIQERIEECLNLLSMSELFDMAAAIRFTCDNQAIQMCCA